MYVIDPARFSVISSPVKVFGEKKLFPESHSGAAGVD
jgi:hypothetical protein